MQDNYFFMTIFIFLIVKVHSDVNISEIQPTAPVIQEMNKQIEVKKTCFQNCSNICLCKTYEKKTVKNNNLTSSTKKWKNKKKQFCKKIKINTKNYAQKILIQNGNLKKFVKFYDRDCFNHFLNIATDWSKEDQNNFEKLEYKILFKVKWNDLQNMYRYIFNENEWKINYMLIRCKIFKDFEGQQSCKTKCNAQNLDKINVEDVFDGILKDMDFVNTLAHQGQNYTITETSCPKTISEYVFSLSFTHQLYKHACFFGQLKKKQQKLNDSKKYTKSHKFLSKAFGNIFAMYDGCKTSYDYISRNFKIKVSKELVDARSVLRKFKLEPKDMLRNAILNQGKHIIETVYTNKLIFDQPSNQLLFKLANCVAILRSDNERNKITKSLKLENSNNDVHKQCIFYLYENINYDKLMKYDLKMMESLLLLGLNAYETMLLELLCAFGTKLRLKKRIKIAKIFFTAYDEVLAKQNDYILQNNNNSEANFEKAQFDTKGMLKYYYDKLQNTITMKKQSNKDQLEFIVKKDKKEEFSLTLLQVFVFYSDLFVASEIKVYYESNKKQIKDIEKNIADIKTGKNEEVQAKILNQEMTNIMQENNLMAATA